MHFVWASSESPAKLAQPLQEPRTAAATASPPEAAPKLPLCLEDDDASGKIVRDCGVGRQSRLDSLLRVPLLSQLVSHFN